MDDLEEKIKVLRSQNEELRRIVKSLVVDIGHLSDRLDTIYRTALKDIERATADDD